MMYDIFSSTIKCLFVPVGKHQYLNHRWELVTVCVCVCARVRVCVCVSLDDGQGDFLFSLSRPEIQGLMYFCMNP